MLLPEVPKTEQEQKKKLRNFLIPESIFDVEFDATLNYRYPQTDYPSIELAARIFDFIFPEPLKVSDKMNLPEKRAFVLTDAEGARQAVRRIAGVLGANITNGHTDNVRDAQ